MCWLGYGSKLSALNAARKVAGQAEVDEDTPASMLWKTSPGATYMGLVEGILLGSGMPNGYLRHCDQ